MCCNNFNCVFGNCEECENNKDECKHYEECSTCENTEFCEDYNE